MSQIFDTILNEVCLDERVTNGIFKLEEDAHMQALREKFIQHGLTKEAAIELSNKMLEGKYPERQAYNKDGILVTFPTPKHKKNAIRNRTHFEEEDAIRLGYLEKPKDKEPRSAPAEEKPKNPIFPGEPKTDVPNKGEEEGNPTTVQQGDKNLAIEPPRGEEKIETPPEPPEKPVDPIKSPEEKEAEKKVVVQMMKGDETALTSVDYPPIQEEKSLTEEQKKQIEESIQFAKDKNYKKVLEILEQYVKKDSN